MFIETRKDSDILLNFLQSINVQVYPSGRRRSPLITGLKNSEKYRFPFDPEARLNTEANNRKHSGLNGYTQTYLDTWVSAKSNEGESYLTLSLAGYLFKINLTKDKTPLDFGNAFAQLLEPYPEGKEITRIYANVLLEEAHLFSGDKQEYYTEILRDQSLTGRTSSEALDLLKTFPPAVTGNELLAEMRKIENYYFSGISFSATPITSIENPKTVGKARSSESRINVYDPVSGNKVKQRLVSLCILEREKQEDNTWTDWKIHEPAKLPFIEHGETENSVVVGDTHVKSAVDDNGVIINPGNLTVDNHTKTATAEITDTIEALTELPETDDQGNKRYNAKVRRALIDALDAEDITATNISVDTLTAQTLNASDIQQQIGEDYYDVPVIFVEPKVQDDKTFYQLQIKRVNFTD